MGYDYGIMCYNVGRIIILQIITMETTSVFSVTLCFFFFFLREYLNWDGSKTNVD